MESFPVAAHLWHAVPPASGEKSGAGPLSWVEVAIETPATTDAFLGASLAAWRKILGSWHLAHLGPKAAGVPVACLGEVATRVG